MVFGMGREERLASNFFFVFFRITDYCSYLGLAPVGGIGSHGRCTAWELQLRKAVCPFIGSIAVDILHCIFWKLLLLLTDYLVLHFSFSSSLFGLPVCWFFHLLLIPGARGCFPPVERFGMTTLWLVVILQFEAPVMASWLTD